jgi:hypothetical protein
MGAIRLLLLYLHCLALLSRLLKRLSFPVIMVLRALLLGLRTVSLETREQQVPLVAARLALQALLSLARTVLLPRCLTALREPRESLEQTVLIALQELMVVLAQLALIPMALSFSVLTALA